MDGGRGRGDWCKVVKIPGRRAYQNQASANNAEGESKL